MNQKTMQDDNVDKNLNQIKNIIAVLSGKVELEKVLLQQI